MISEGSCDTEDSDIYIYKLFFLLYYCILL